MKCVKINKRDLKDCETLLRKVGAISEDGTRAFPGDVYLSKEDYKTLTKNATERFVKENPGATKESATKAVRWYLLNLGPNESLQDCIRPGYALVKS